MATYQLQNAAGDIIDADVDNAPVIGLVQDVVAIPVDRVTSFTEDGTYGYGLITAITTSSAGQIHRGRKSENDIHRSVNPLGKQRFQHMVTGIPILDPSHEILDDLQRTVAGGDRFHVITRSRWQGAGGLDQFHIHGRIVGMVAQLEAYNSGENEGAYILSFMTPDGEHEPFLPPVFSSGTVANDISDFEAGFA